MRTMGTKFIVTLPPALHSTTATTGSPHQLHDPYSNLCNKFPGRSLVFLDRGTKVLQSVSKHLPINTVYVPETPNLQIIMKWSILNLKLNISVKF